MNHRSNPPSRRPGPRREAAAPPQVGASPPLSNPAAPARHGALPPPPTDALLAGRSAAGGAESLAAHTARLGALPRGSASLIDSLERSGLRGRGGAAFPAGTKWRSVAAGTRGRGVVLANGAEGEPLSHKDRVLMTLRPHLVIDGAVLAAQSVGARRIVFYVGADHASALRSMRIALEERGGRDRVDLELVAAPARYVSGEESAAVHFVDDGVALPVYSVHRPYERGVGGHATLVQNVETLAQAALIARRGDAWFRSIGAGTPGTMLVTVSGAVAQRGVLEVAGGSTIASVIAAAGGASAPPSAVLLGGYFGGWINADRAMGLPLDAMVLRGQGHALGCGVIAVLPEQSCGVIETARIISYLADQSARQCGPCVFGLRAIADAANRIAATTATGDDIVRVRRWSTEMGGRGACKHPDGAAGLMLSALNTFGDEMAMHASGRCSVRMSMRMAAA